MSAITQEVLLSRLRKNPVICMDSANVTAMAADTIESQQRDIDELQHALDCMTTEAGEMQDIINATATSSDACKPSHEALIADIDLYLANGHYATLRPKASFLLKRAREALQEKSDD